MWTGAVGDGAVVAIEGKDAAEFTLVKVDAFKTASPYGTLERARHGWFVKATMRFKGLQSGVDVNPYDYYVRTSDGRRFDAGDGNSLGVEGDNGLEGTTLSKGEKLTATMAFECRAGMALWFTHQVIRLLGSGALGASPRLPSPHRRVLAGSDLLIS